MFNLRSRSSLSRSVTQDDYLRGVPMASPRKKAQNNNVQQPSTSVERNEPRPGHEVHEPTGSTEVMTFYPTWAEFRDFPGYLKKIEQAGAHLKCGIAKVVPPPGWHPRPKKKSNYSNVDDYVIKEPVKETIEGHGGIFMKTNKVFRKEMPVKEYRKLANSAKMKNPKPDLAGTELERHYWRSILQGEPIYGADTEGSIYEEGVQEFNMNHLGTVLDEISESTQVKIKGVNTVYMYFGMWKTTFPWHAEDMDLYSINYLHFGAPKYWYGISSESAERFERLASQLFPSESPSCKAFLRHKNFIISPTILRNNNIPYGTMIQRQNEFMITFPKGYHMGFNTGYNCAESTNFASDRWIDFGKNSLVCKCRPDSVEIDMRPFMKKYRPKEFTHWEQYWYGERSVITKCRITGKRITTVQLPSTSSKPNDVPQSPAPKRPRHSLSSPQSSSDSTSDLSPASPSQPVLSSGVGRQRAATRTKRKKIGGRALVHLWACTPVNLFAEKEWNKKRALEEPHCAVCLYFQPPNQIRPLKRIPHSSSRMCSNLCFAKDPRRVPPISDPAEDLLLTCSNCCVTVHQNCYAKVPFDPDNIESWRCLRCYNRDDTLIRGTSCHLCELRGGAYVRCRIGNEDSWVHVVCAILNRRTSFEDPLTRTMTYHEPPPKQGFEGDTNVRLTPDYKEALGDDNEIARFECELCCNPRESLLKCSACESDVEPTLVHATCARLGKMYIERREYPLVAVLVCDRHDEDSDTEFSEGRLCDIRGGETVVVWLNNGHQVERGFVMQSFDKVYCMIDFLDGSVSRNTLTSDIVTCDCMVCDGKNHQKGAMVRVRWTDNSVYEAYFRRLLQVKEYWVRLNSDPHGQPVIVSRMDIYSTAEKLPNEVLRRLQACEQPSRPALKPKLQQNS